MGVPILRPLQRATMRVDDVFPRQKPRRTRLAVACPVQLIRKGTRDFPVCSRYTFGTYISTVPRKTEQTAGKISLSAAADGLPVGKLDAKAFLLSGSLRQ
jgi:hypothetical protein